MFCTCKIICVIYLHHQWVFFNVYSLRNKVQSAENRKVCGMEKCFSVWHILFYKRVHEKIYNNNNGLM